jgi:hypothetical protein
VSDITGVWAIYLVKHHLSFKRVSEFSHDSVPVSLELLAPVTLLHVEISDNDFVDIVRGQQSFEFVKRGHLSAKGLCPPVWLHLSAYD